MTADEKIPNPDDFPQIQTSSYGKLSGDQSINYHTNSSTQNVLIYNRVPKTGSQTMRSILVSMSQRNQFRSLINRHYASYSKTKVQEQQFVKRISGLELQGAKTLLDGHFYFVNCQHYLQDARWVWFNMVRHPVDRFISDFYYLRSYERWKDIKEKPPKVSKITL